MPPEKQEDPQLQSVRSILLAQEWERIAALEEELKQLRQVARTQQERADKLEQELERLRQEFKEETESLIPRLTAQLSGIISRTIQNSKHEMAQALAPIMGEAIRAQIRKSRDDMVEALYPIIGSTVARAIAEFAREFQRNIDVRLRSTFGPAGLWRTLRARLRGVSPSELALRDALPFAIEELFLIQHETGLLMAHSHLRESDVSDSDLISGMLTAIRDFARDSFGQGDVEQELDEIQYGDERIIIVNGRYAYLAVVITGVEPEGFRYQLRSYLSELHVEHDEALRDYAGDPATLPDLENSLTQLAESLSAESGPKPMGRTQKLALAGGGLFGILLLGVACFYLQFTIALWPLAFGQTPTATAVIPTATPTSTPSPTATLTPSPTTTTTPSATPTATPTNTSTPLPTFTPTPRPTNTPPPTVTAVPTSPPPITIGAVWAFTNPTTESQQIAAIPANTPVQILAQTGIWVEVSWTDNNNIEQRGWIPLQWIRLTEPISPDIITPIPGS
ncbi:MAG: SH3 domain-containing protein [Chloroflexi bacterium]|nr:MAG: SH3 domain-containing protein [Chloroflexota bacterium]